ncbi:MAG: type I-U CRISPR-associated helicase/endonuclease Cas3 [Desulfobacteraceae bacterium]|nr:type I-U CRISPR-associated helicase/endonuclease Cas3 [Desulfobacteraceae bacterium]
MSFANFFHTATGNQPFPWQIALYEKFANGQIPTAANIPTGLGKTSIVAIWLIALAFYPDKVPRRLVYVVNRRTVVDQTTDEVEKLRMALSEKPGLREIAEKLRSLCALPMPTPECPPLAVSTLRGQFADNREWSADPARPAVIIGTVDMIGSGLLFSRYTVGFKLRPHHAAFLAQDVLLVHDEAHLEPAFQHLLSSIVAEQTRSREWRKFRVMELSATTRSMASNQSLELSKDDENNEFVKKRLNAVKKLACVAPAEKEKAADKIFTLALEKKDSSRAILIFVRSVDDATKIAAALDKGALKDKVVTLTGTMRGKERDELVQQPIFQRFLPDSSRMDNIVSADGTVFLVATSAGEVGVNISADDLVCDLSTYESMAQRFGRVNRFGMNDDSTVTVVYPNEFPHTKKISDAKHEVAEGKKDAEKKLQEAKEKFSLDIAIENTLGLLHKLAGDASPAALDRLPADERAAAFSPPPKMRTATDVQFDAWALTSIRETIAARPPVAPYLHGEAEWEPAETHVAWREEVEVVMDELLDLYPPEELLSDYPLKPHELLCDVSNRVLEKIASLAAAASNPKLSIWLVSESGEIKILPISCFADLSATYSKGASKQTPQEKRAIERLKTEIADATIILPPSLGGIKNGLLSADHAGNNDVADVSEIQNTRLRIYSATPELPERYAANYRLTHFIDTKPEGKDDEIELPRRYWLWLEVKNALHMERRTASQPERLAEHTAKTMANAAAIAETLLPAAADREPDLRRCLVVAAQLHDPGKNRRQWQLSIGNNAYDPSKPETILAKSGGAMRSRNLAENYRHEFGSLADALTSADFTDLSSMERDIVLHLVAAHHGRARPHYPVEEVFDYNSLPDACAALAAEVPPRFARLQRVFGRWGLTWLESLLRSADYAASAGTVAKNAALPVHRNDGKLKQYEQTAIQKDDELRITLHVDVANPGQYFACCGLFELTARLAPQAMAHFEQDGAAKQWRFIIVNAIKHDGQPLTLEALFDQISVVETIATDPNDTPQTPLRFGEPFNLLIDWWRHEGGRLGKLKTWAGQMGVLSIAEDMKKTLRKILLGTGTGIENILFTRSVENAGQPFYFDANYAVNAQAQDVGFSVDKLKKGGIKVRTAIVPAAELLCLIGLQRCRPMWMANKSGQERLYDYYVWNQKLPVSLVSAAVAGYLPTGCQRLRFANPSRAKDYRAFLPAVFM